MGKTISFIGNPGTGKTTFLVASMHRLDELRWAKMKVKHLPKDYGLWIDALISGQPLPPTVKEYEYPLSFAKSIKYKHSTIKTGRFSGISFRVKDIRGEDYRRTSDKFKESVNGVSAVLITIDASKSNDMGEALGGQVQPLIDGIRYMISTQKSIKYIALVLTKRSYHNHPIRKMREYVDTFLGPILRYLKEKRITFRILECDSRGVEGKFKPWGVEAIYYDVLSHLGTVSGTPIDITTDPDHVWVDTRPVVPTPPPSAAAPAEHASGGSGQSIEKSTATSSPKGLSQAHSPTKETSEPRSPTPPIAPVTPAAPQVGVVYMVICPSCGHKNPQGLSKCDNCGGAL